MPLTTIDRRTAKAEARSLLRSAKVSPLRLTLLYLAIELLLSEIGTALDRLTQESSAALDPTTITPDELLDLFASFFIARTPIQWTVLFLSIFISLLLWVLKAGYSSYCLGVSRGELTPYDSLFDGFAFVGKVLALTFLILLLIGVGLSFFLLPGILFFLMYRFALYNLCADPSISIWEAMKRSRLQTDGRKMDLFLLNLSFLPLILLLLAAEVAVSMLLSPLFAYTLSGDLLYSFFAFVITSAVTVFLMPYMELAHTVYFVRLTAAPADEPPQKPSATDF